MIFENQLFGGVRGWHNIKLVFKNSICVNQAALPFYFIPDFFWIFMVLAWLIWSSMLAVCWSCDNVMLAPRHNVTMSSQLSDNNNINLQTGNQSNSVRVKNINISIWWILCFQNLTGSDKERTQRDNKLVFKISQFLTPLHCYRLLQVEGKKWSDTNLWSYVRLRGWGGWRVKMKGSRS